MAAEAATVSELELTLELELELESESESESESDMESNVDPGGKEESRGARGVEWGRRVNPLEGRR